MSDALNIGDARDQVLDHLDDPRGARYAKTVSSVQDFSRVDRALRSSQSSCLDDYVVAGGDRFIESVDVTTSASTGAVSLAEYDPAGIRAVLVAPDSDGAKFPLDEGDPTVLGVPDLNERDLSVILTRRFQIPNPADEGDWLMGTTQGAARSWAAFDEWVCARAAMQLGVKDMEGSSRLGELVAEKRESVLGHIRTPRGEPWPARRGQSWSLRRMKWVFMPQTRTLSVVFDSSLSWWRW